MLPSLSVAESERPELSKARVSERPEAELVQTVQRLTCAGQAPEPAASMPTSVSRRLGLDLLVRLPEEEKLKVVGWPSAVAHEGPAALVLLVPVLPRSLGLPHNSWWPRCTTTATSPDS